MYCGLLLLHPRRTQRALLENYEDYLPVQPEEIKKWFTDGSDYNIAVITGRESDLFVFDADSQFAVEFLLNSCFCIFFLISLSK